jgi:transposase InsO family protein
MSSENGTVPPLIPLPSPVYVTVGNGAWVPVCFYSNMHLCLPSSNFVLKNVIRVPSLIQNLISVHQFTRDNAVSIEFDPFGFSVKDLRIRHVIIRCNSSGDLYTIPPVTDVSSPKALVSSATTSTVWHARLGHPGNAVFNKLQSSRLIQCNKPNHRTCHACQLGKHVRLPFSSSVSSSKSPFELIHYDVWTSPVVSTSGFKYYLVLLDDFTHFCWTFPLKQKSDVFHSITTFHSYVHTQFGLPIKVLQADNDTEFVNHTLFTFLDQHDIVTRLSCPYTSPQNGKAERVLRTINNTIRTLLIHAFMPSTYWVEALSTATFLINRLPSTKTPNTTPFQLLHNKPPTYSDLWVFGCLCYPNTSATATHKLSPRLVPCVFLGYPSSHKGYHCLNLVTQKLIISRHVIFDETVFPFRFRYPDGHGTSMDFLLPPASYPLMAQGAGLGDTHRPPTSLLPSPKMMSSHWLPQYVGPGHRLWLAPMVRARGIHLHHRRLLLRAHPHRNRTRCMVMFTSMDPCM